MAETAGKKTKSARARRPPLPQEQAPESLANEIAMLRSLMQRAANMVDDNCQLGELLEVLEKVGKAQTRLVTLLKAQQSLGEEGGLSAYLNRALDELNQELAQENQARRQRTA